MRNAAAVCSAPSSVPPLPQASALAEGKTRQQESFPIAWLVGAQRREPLLAYYAFARAGDDLADHRSLAPPAKLAALEALRQGLDGGPDAPPEAKALRGAFAEAGLPTDLLHPLLDAFCFDAQGPVRIADANGLIAYCEQSAVPVGRFLLALYDEPTRPEVLAACDALCIALQGLNHLQGLGTDWRHLDRCYLPQQWLAEVGCSHDALSSTACSSALRAALERMRLWCGELITQAQPLPRLLRSRRLAAQAAATLSTAISLHALLAEADPLRAEPSLSKRHWAKAGLASLGPLLTPRRRSRP